jgi:hypothetical protein
VISGSLIDMGSAENDNAYRKDGTGRQFKYSEEDGVMRGARIAEKIQEFYHTKQPMGTSGPVVLPH